MFLDWFHPESKKIWADGLNDLYKEMPFDGIWLDMNEITGFCNGDLSDTSEQCVNMKTARAAELSGQSLPLENNVEEIVKFLQAGGTRLVARKYDDQPVTNTSWFQHYDNNMTEASTYYLPFIPSLYFNFDNMTLSLNATHPSNNETQYNTHSLFGHMECKATREILIEGEKELAAFKDKRQFLLSRSTFSGSGQHTSHWLGDNHRGWDDMRYSIAGIMNFNMFGIPHVGADVCGFFANTGVSEDENKEICGRWMQLATFYPFARQHRNEVGG